jgi:hypothetical protein
LATKNGRQGKTAQKTRKVSWAVLLLVLLVFFFSHCSLILITNPFFKSNSELCTTNDGIDGGTRGMDSEENNNTVGGSLFIYFISSSYCTFLKVQTQSIHNEDDGRTRGMVRRRKQPTYNEGREGWYEV